jgi:hypothetical protein
MNFPGVIKHSLPARCLGAAQVDRAALHIDPVAFIVRSSASLNKHLYFHVAQLPGCSRR